MVFESSPGVAAQDSVALRLDPLASLWGLLVEEVIEVGVDSFECGVMVFPMGSVHAAVVLSIAVAGLVDDGTLHGACELDVDGEVFVKREFL